MLKLSKITDYSILILTILHKSPDNFYNSNDIVKKTKLPLPTVRKILSILSSRQLITSERGAGGGYSISNYNISLLDIVECIEGPVQITECCKIKNSNCKITQCNLPKYWRKINFNVKQMLSNILVKDL